MIPEPGIYYDIAFEDYKAWDAVNVSKLKPIVQKSPAHARFYTEEETETTDALIAGQAYHTLALEADKFDSRFAIIPECDRRTKEGKEIYSQFLTTKGNKQELTQDQFKTVKTMAERLKSTSIFNYIDEGTAEVCMVWIDAKTGLRCKARVDFLRESQAFLFDLKSTTSAHPEDVSQSVIKFGYCMQAAFYCDGYTQITGDPSSFVFIFQEKTPPYLPAAYECFGPEMIIGQKMYRLALDTYADCLRTNNWYGYKPIQKLELPKWYLSKYGYIEKEVI